MVIPFRTPTHCPKCGKKIEPHQYRRYPKENHDLVIHELKVDLWGLPELVKSCTIYKEGHPNYGRED